MWPNWAEAGWFKLNVFYLYLAAAAVAVGFAVWQRFRMDYKDEEIFGLTLNLLAAAAAGNLAGTVLETGSFAGISGWGMAAGVWAALWRWCSRNKIDFWEQLDWFAVLGLWLWLAGAAAYGPTAMQPGLAGAAIVLVLTAVVKANYRKFRWYSSGRVGLTGLAALAGFSGYEIVTGFAADPAKMYWWGLTLNQTISAWVIAFCVSAVYLRSGNKIRFPDRFNVRISRHEKPQPNQNQSE